MCSITRSKLPFVLHLSIKAYRVGARSRTLIIEPATRFYHIAAFTLFVSSSSNALPGLLPDVLDIIFTTIKLPSFYTSKLYPPVHNFSAPYFLDASILSFSSFRLQTVSGN